MTRIGSFAGRFAVGRRRGRRPRPRTIRCRTGVCTASCFGPGPALRFDVPSADPCGSRDRTAKLEGTRLMLRASALSLTCAVLALTAAACGESGSGGDDGPAALVPASASIYAEASVRPEGELRDDALAAAGKILRTDDPAGRLRELIDEGLAEDAGGLTWEKDFAPWLGERVGFWADNLEREEPSFAAIAATTDTEAARSAIQKFKQQDAGEYTKRSHAGVDYEVNADGTAAAIIDDFLVVGSEDAFKRTAELAEDGEALADADRYRNAIDDLEEDRLGQFFFDSKVIMQAASEQDPASAEALSSSRGPSPSTS